MCPFPSSTSLYSCSSTNSPVWSVIRFFLLYSDVSCTKKTEREKEKHQRLAISSQRETLLSSRSPVSIRDESHEWKTGTVIFNLSERLADSTSPQRLDVSRSHSWNIKAKWEPRAYAIVGHTLERSPRTGKAAHVHERPRGLGPS